MLSRLSSAQVEPESSQPVGSVWQIFFIWLKIGVQSFGGGTTVGQLIRREMIYKRGWMTELDYTNFWTLCNLVPGVNFIAFAIIIGRKLAGLRGSFACVLGLMLPSAVITILMTAGFVSVRQQSVVQAMLKGIVPAIVGITFLFVIQFGQPLFKQGLKEGSVSLSVSLLFSASVAVLLGVVGWSAVVVLVLAGVAGALIFPLVWGKSTNSEKPE